MTENLNKAIFFRKPFKRTRTQGLIAIESLTFNVFAIQEDMVKIFFFFEIEGLSFEISSNCILSGNLW